MKESDDKYAKVLELLRQSKPVLDRSSEIEEKVYSGILLDKKTQSVQGMLTGILFGWTSVNWVRRCLVSAAVILIIVFIFQQSIILREIDQLNERVEAVRSNASVLTGDELSRKIMFLRLSEKKFPFDSRKISDRRIEEFLNSCDRLGKEYKDLQNVIESDPELKKLIAKKLSDINSSKVKL